MTSEGAEEELEAKHVHSVYSQIASHFSDTRYKPWPKVAQFLQQLPPGSLVADVGCGNGKYFPVSCTRACGYMIGCDMCRELIAIAASRGHEVSVANSLNLPYRTNSFDAVISIAVIHHLSSRSRRQRAVGELVRVVSRGGRILLYVWAMEQERKKFTEQDVMVPWHLQPRYGTADRDQSGGGATKRKMNTKQRAMRRKGQMKDDGNSGKVIAGSGGGGEGCEGGREEEGGEGEWGLAALYRSEDTHGTQKEGPVTINYPTALSDLTSCSTEERQITSCSVTAAKSNSRNDQEPLKVDHTTDHVTSKRDHMTSMPSLEAQGYQTFHRYYHVFQKNELSALFNEVGGVRVIEEFYDHENWCVVAEKIT